MRPNNHSGTSATISQFGATDTNVARILVDLMLEESHDVRDGHISVDNSGSVLRNAGSNRAHDSDDGSAAGAADEAAMGRPAPVQRTERRMITRRASRAVSAETRAKISATIRAKAAARGQFSWDDAHVHALRKAFATGGKAAVQEAFPHLRERQIYGAIARYCKQEHVVHVPIRSGGSVWNDPEFNRRFMEALTGRTYSV